MDHFDKWYDEEYPKMLRYVTRCARGSIEVAKDALGETFIVALESGWLVPTQECKARILKEACPKAYNSWRLERDRRRLLGCGENPRNTRHQFNHDAFLKASMTQPAEQCDDAAKLLTRIRPCLHALHATNYQPAVVDFLLVREVIPGGCEHLIQQYGVTLEIIAGWKSRRTHLEQISDRSHGLQRFGNCLASRGLDRLSVIA